MELFRRELGLISPIGIVPSIGFGGIFEASTQLPHTKGYTPDPASRDFVRHQQYIARTCVHKSLDEARPSTGSPASGAATSFLRIKMCSLAAETAYDPGDGPEPREGEGERGE